MENKKQLILIPPMSEALKKLYEVLTTISEDENVEISIIDDLKELSQFIATTGQCLILASNAKKCANFLQENRFILAKYHCKTILFTPKEIPSKTLVKFTKIGLTESILENSPPKTFLYKIKLQLRSIKTNNAQEDSEKFIKSLENNKMQNSENSDFDLKEKNFTENNIIDDEMNKKNLFQANDQVLDYSDKLKEKIKLEEESIDTNWKTERKKDINIDFTKEKETPVDSAIASIDMYLRGKNKLDSMLEFDEEDLGKSKKFEIVNLDPDPAKKSSYADVIEEGSMKQKRLNHPPLQLEDQEKKAIAEIDLFIESRKNKKSFDEIDSDLDIDLNRRRQQNLEEEAKTKDKMIEDIGGYLKGKLNTDIRSDEEIDNKSRKDYDNSEIHKEANSQDFDLDLLTEDEQASEKNSNDPLLDNVHDGLVDKIDSNMIGDSGTVDKIRTRMNGTSDRSNKPQQDEEDMLTYGRKKENTDIEEEDSKKEKHLSNELEIEDTDSIEKTHDGDDEIEFKDSHEDIELLDDDNDNDNKETDDSANTLKEHDRKKQISLEIQLEKSAAKTTTENEEDSSFDSRDSSSLKQEKNGNKIHDGHVEQIDSFYRGGESKKKDQNWDNLTDKKNTTQSVFSSKKSGMTLMTAEQKEYDETTIDYRKLKEEFDLMYNGDPTINNIDNSYNVNSNLKNNEDGGSFKVLEINPLSLDFSINIINSILNKDIKSKQIFAMLTDELINHYHCFPVFYKYSLSDKKFSEIFNSFLEIHDNRVSSEKKSWWSEFKNDTNLFEHYHKKTMTTWRCPEIVNDGVIWEDVELPSWAQQELTNKHIELIFPYFDGLDRMGLAVAIFPEGINPKAVNGLLTVLEMARTLFLDTIERYKVVQEKEVISTKEETQKKTVLSFFNGLFGKKKAS